MLREKNSNLLNVFYSDSLGGSMFTSDSQNWKKIPADDNRYFWKFPSLCLPIFYGLTCISLLLYDWVSCASPRLTGNAFCWKNQGKMPHDRNCNLWATWVNSRKNEIFYQQEGRQPSNPSVKIAASLMEDLVCKGPSCWHESCSSASSSITSWWGFLTGPS